MCDPKIFYQCLVEKVKDYVRDNEAAKCNCPRQCSRLIYEPTISQATLSPAIAKLVAADSRQSVEQVTNDHCIVEVCLSDGTRITLSYGRRLIHVPASLSQLDGCICTVEVILYGTRWPSVTRLDFAIARSRVRLPPVAAVYQRLLSVPSLRGRLMSSSLRATG